MSGAYGPWPTVVMTNGEKPNYPAWLRAYERRQALRSAALGLVCLLAGLLTGLLLGGCATMGTTKPRVGQEAAVWVIWRSYGRTDPPPAIRWLRDSDLDCDDPQSGKRGFTIIDVDTSTGEGPVRCREGFTMSPAEVLVADHGEASIADMPVAHELRHVYFIRVGIYLDHHQRPDFYPAIDVANQLVREAGY